MGDDSKPLRMVCPCCGGTMVAGQLAGAGTHELGLVTIKGLGRGKGFGRVISPVAGRPSLLRALRDSLAAALAQVDAMIAKLP